MPSPATRFIITVRAGATKGTASNREIKRETEQIRRLGDLWNVQGGNQTSFYPFHSEVARRKAARAIGVAASSLSLVLANARDKSPFGCAEEIELPEDAH